MRLIYKATGIWICRDEIAGLARAPCALARAHMCG